MDRRSFLRIAALTASAAPAACTPQPKFPGNGTVDAGVAGRLSEHERRVLDRVCFGISTTEAQRVAEIGLQGWMEEQLEESSPPELDLRWRLRNLDVLNKTPDAIEKVHKRSEVVEQLRTGTLLRQIYSKRQIYEMLVEFWGDHFNISVEKGPGWALKVTDDREVIRKYPFGPFHDLLFASAHSPAMLVYLDNQANDKAAPNENYARELLELHTLGIDGGYTQSDIVGLARCLTGWTVKEHFWRGQFMFDEERHDRGAKQVFGMKIDPAGKAELEQILEYLARNPATAEHLAVKLVRRFMCDDPIINAPGWVARLRDVYMTTRGNIRAVLRKLMLDGIAREPATLGTKVKRPVDFVTSALRITGADTDGGKAVHNLLARMGQPTFAWPTPDGPPDVAESWVGNLSPRWEFSVRLMTGRIEGTELSTAALAGLDLSLPPSDTLSAVSMRVLGRMLPDSVSKDLIKSVGEVGQIGEQDRIRAVIAGLLASPTFQYR